MTRVPSGTGPSVSKPKASGAAATAMPQITLKAPGNPEIDTTEAHESVPLSVAVTRKTPGVAVPRLAEPVKPENDDDCAGGNPLSTARVLEVGSSCPDGTDTIRFWLESMEKLSDIRPKRIPFN